MSSYELVYQKLRENILNGHYKHGDELRETAVGKEIGYHIPSRTPFVGSNFNVTRAGIHADGLLKNEEIYNIFNTQKFLNRPAMVAVSNTSGLAGIAHWINTYFHLPEEKKLDKNCELVHEVKKWVDAEYESGRVTVLTDEELLKVIDDASKKLGILLV